MLLGDIYNATYHKTSNFRIKIVKDRKIVFDGVLNSNKFANLSIMKYWYDIEANKFICIAE